MTTTLAALAHLLTRYDAMPDPVRISLRPQIAKLLPAADAEFDALGDKISVRRDWLDMHAGDQPVHAQYEKRKHHFFTVDSRSHAEAGELLERAHAAITTSDQKAAA